MIQSCYHATPYDCKLRNWLQTLKRSSLTLDLPKQFLMLYWKAHRRLTIKNMNFLTANTDAFIGFVLFGILREKIIMPNCSSNILLRGLIRKNVWWLQDIYLPIPADFFFEKWKWTYSWVSIFRPMSSIAIVRNFFSSSLIYQSVHKISPNQVISNKINILQNYHHLLSHLWLLS